MHSEEGEEAKCAGAHLVGWAPLPIWRCRRTRSRHTAKKVRTTGSNAAARLLNSLSPPLRESKVLDCTSKLLSIFTRNLSTSTPLLSEQFTGILEDCYSLQRWLSQKALAMDKGFDHPTGLPCCEFRFGCEFIEIWDKCGHCKNDVPWPSRFGRHLDPHRPDSESDLLERTKGVESFCRGSTA